MKKLILIIIALTSTQLFAQTTKHMSSTAGRDSSLRVIIVDKEQQKKQPGYFVNGRFVESLGHISPKVIESLNIIKSDTLVGNKIYSVQIHATTKTDYVPNLISLADLKKKYTSFKDMPVVFMIDTDFINADEESYYVDENSLLTIVVDKLGKNKNNMEIGLIKLLTKSEKNIIDRNTIRIRGEEMVVNR